ncbi:fumarylacetoacetase [Nocardia sp. CA-107356]|uniref:fumarylacetoacetase n=1 Tax=Nocardia sp. CA-107356 TaxID=3239972 RepID=UPI003D90166F
MTDTWLTTPDDTDFPIGNLPYGVFSTAALSPRIGVAIGDHVLDLRAVIADPVFAATTLNAFLRTGPVRWRATRDRVTELLTQPSYRDQVTPHLYHRAEVRLHLPFEVSDYVDFYASRHHAMNLGRLFRPGMNPLPANWEYLPSGYHGRAGTVVVSGTPIVRPSGQYRPDQHRPPRFGPSQCVDIEAEIGFVVGVPSPQGQRVAPSEFAQHVFGAVLVNDWSARDIQRWEYTPLGPFLGKSFATSISPWVVTLDALQAARIEGPRQLPSPLTYLQRAEPWGLDIDLEVHWNDTLVSRPPFADMYWTADQQLAHLTANGAALRTGDLFASGTISGPEPQQRGSFVELTWDGATPVTLRNGTTRSYLHDGDTVTIRATTNGTDGRRIGFGEVTGTITAY